MFGAIIITFVITVLLMSVAFLVNFNQQRTRETQQLRRENDNLHKQVDDFYNRERASREKRAYNQGLHDGRETDSLYRKMLSKYNKGEQATIMMYGDNRRRNNDE